MNDLEEIVEKAGALFQVCVIGTVVAVIAGGAVAAQDLGEFPQNFINEDGDVETAVIVGDEAKTMDTIGAVNIVGSLSEAASEHSSSDLEDENLVPNQNYNDIGLYSTGNVNDEMMEQDMILVGGPQVNELTKELAENGDIPGHEEFEQDEAVIKLVEDAFQEDQNALIVAGYSSQATMDAANFLAEYHENEERLEGEQKIRIDTSEVGQDDFNQLLDEQ